MRAVSAKPGSTPTIDASLSTSTGDLILDAAVELFALRGYHATSMRDIARSLSMQPAGIYHWYESKESILAELQMAFLTDLTSSVADAVSPHRRPEDRLAAAVREHVVFHGEHPRAAFVADSEVRALSGANRENIVAKRDTYQGMFIQLIEDGQRAGVFTVSDARIAGYAILLECTGVATWFRPDGAHTLEEVAEIHIELVLGSLGTNRSAIRRAVAATHKVTPRG